MKIRSALLLSVLLLLAVPAFAAGLPAGATLTQFPGVMDAGAKPDNTFSEDFTTDGTAPELDGAWGSCTSRDMDACWDGCQERSDRSGYPINRVECRVTGPGGPSCTCVFDIPGPYNPPEYWPRPSFGGGILY